MRKIIILTLIMIALFTSTVAANEITDTTEIPEMTLEILIQNMKARQAKVDIIKKNNIEITNLKTDLKAKIVDAANKVNSLKIEVLKDTVVITEETLEELKELLTFLQEAKKTLEEDVEKISKEIESILDLIEAKGMQLDQYDLIIEKQNMIMKY